MSELVTLLLDLHRSRGSGVLRGEQGRVTRQVVVLRGFMAAAESNQSEEHLAQILFRQKLLTRKDLAEISRLIRQGSAPDEAILAASQVGKPAMLQGAAEQLLQILAQFMTSSGCQLRYYSGEGLVKRQIDLGLPIPDVLVQAGRKAAAQNSSKLNSSWLLQRLHPPASADDLRILPLDPVEAFALSRVEEPITTGDLLALIPSGSASPQEIILRLIYFGCLRTEIEPPKRDLAQPERDALEKDVEDLVRKNEIADLYEILSVASDADAEDIRSAYHALARKYHPDRFQSAEYSPSLKQGVETLFTQIVGAYSTLGNVDARARYDETRRRDTGGAVAGGHTRAAEDAEREKMSEALFKAGFSAIQRGDFEKAVEHLKECVWLRPDVDRFHHFLGLAQSEVPRYRKEAERHLLRAIELNHAGSESYLALGRLYLKASLPHKARQQFVAALRWDPENREAQALLEQLAE